MKSTRSIRIPGFRKPLEISSPQVPTMRSERPMPSDADADSIFDGNDLLAKTQINILHIGTAAMDIATATRHVDQPPRSSYIFSSYRPKCWHRPFSKRYQDQSNENHVFNSQLRRPSRTITCPRCHVDQRPGLSVRALIGPYGALSLTNAQVVRI
jgi:hypothetical protein